MTNSSKRYTGGCLCGALRYEAAGEPRGAGLCYCSDCRKASGSGFIPYMDFAAGAVRIVGDVRQTRAKAARGGISVRNFCARCSSLVFGGDIGKSEGYTIYAGSLDDTSAFEPKTAIFASKRPPWAIIPGGLAIFDTMPPRAPGSNDMSDEIALVERVYREFNARNIDALLDVMDPGVNWPNGWEGGYVIGHDGVRDYWTRQWAKIDPTVTPDGFEALSDGRVRVRVHQLIKDRAGKLMSDRFVYHTYSFAAGKIQGMVIEPA